MNSIEFQLPLNSTPPYTIYVCDGFGNNCVFLALSPTNQPTSPIYLPPQFNNAPMIIIKIVDALNCVTEKTYFCGINEPAEQEILDAFLIDGSYLMVGEDFYLKFV